MKTAVHLSLMALLCATPGLGLEGPARAQLDRMFPSGPGLELAPSRPAAAAPAAVGRAHVTDVLPRRSWPRR